MAGEGVSRAISVDDLLLLNQEIAALVRAGTPLERGLLLAGRDVRGRLGRIAQALSGRMSQGESFLSALEHERDAIPPLYRAVVEAGVRSGRLPSALEGLTRYVRGYSEARSAIGIALWYPLLIGSIAYGLFLGMSTLIAPKFAEAFPSLGLKLPWTLDWINRIGQASHLWWPVGPIVLIGIGIAWSVSGRAARFQSWAWGLPRLMPGMKRLMADYETANFAELLALLLEHNVPYPAAVLLAAQATGNRPMTAAAQEIAAALERGQSPGAALENVRPGVFQPMIRWAMSTGADSGSLPESLAGMADHYRSRARHRAESMRIFLPALLLVVLGGGAALVYGLSLFLPLVELLKELSFG